MLKLRLRLQHQHRHSTSMVQLFNMTTEIKILGVTITSTLNWSVHADQVRTKISRMSGVLQRFGCTLDSHTRLRIFNAFILPHVLYCLPVWGNLPTSHCDLFNRSLLRCAKMIQRNVRTELGIHTMLLVSCHLNNLSFFVMC